MAELDEITTERDNLKRGCKQRLNEFMAGFNVTNKLKNYQMLTLENDAELELVDSLDPLSEGIMFRSADTLTPTGCLTSMICEDSSG